MTNLTLFVQNQAFTSCECLRGFPRHLAARGFNCQRAPGASDHIARRVQLRIGQSQRRNHSIPSPLRRTQPNKNHTWSSSWLIISTKAVSSSNLFRWVQVALEHRELKVVAKIATGLKHLPQPFVIGNIVDLKPNKSCAWGGGLGGWGWGLGWVPFGFFTSSTLECIQQFRRSAFWPTVASAIPAPGDSSLCSRRSGWVISELMRILIHLEKAFAPWRGEIDRLTGADKILFRNDTIVDAT